MFCLCEGSRVSSPHSELWASVPQILRGEWSHSAHSSSLARLWDGDNPGARRWWQSWDFILICSMLGRMGCLLQCQSEISPSLTTVHSLPISPFLKEMKFGTRKVTCFSSRNFQECILADILTTCTSLTTITWAGSFWWLGPHRGCSWNPTENPVPFPLSFIRPPPPTHLWNPKVSEKGTGKVQGLKTWWRVAWKRLALCWLCCTSHVVWSFS